MNSELKKAMRQIAGFYGCKVRFKDQLGGAWAGPYIVVGTLGNMTVQVSVFAHELAHFINWKTGRYPRYHDPKTFNTFHKRFKHLGQAVRYALNAEIFTEIEGKKLCKEWFPKIKYITSYRDNQSSYHFLLGYYFAS